MRNCQGLLGQIVVGSWEGVEAHYGCLVRTGCSAARIEVEGLVLVSTLARCLELEDTHQDSHSVAEIHLDLAEGYYSRTGHHPAAEAEAYCIVVVEVHSCRGVALHTLRYHILLRLAKSLAVGTVEALESMIVEDNHQLGVVWHRSLAGLDRRP